MYHANTVRLESYKNRCLNELRELLSRLEGRWGFDAMITLHSVPNHGLRLVLLDNYYLLLCIYLETDSVLLKAGSV